MIYILGKGCFYNTSRYLGTVGISFIGCLASTLKSNTMFYILGDVVRQVRAVDADGDVITYEIVSHSGDSADIFFITPSNGEIRTLKSLTTAAQQSYTVSIVEVYSRLTC